jgi:hypothetical protein
MVEPRRVVVGPFTPRSWCPVCSFVFTSETVVVDVEIQHQRYGVLHVLKQLKVGSQLNIPTMLLLFIVRVKWELKRLQKVCWLFFQGRHNVDPCIWLRVGSWLYVLSGNGQSVVQPPSHESFWHPNELQIGSSDPSLNGHWHYPNVSDIALMSVSGTSDPSLNGHWHSR